MSSRVLYVCHNHPAVRPGGAEGYALALHRAMRSTPNWESVFLAHSGPPLTSVRRYHDGALLALDERAPDEYYCYNEFANFDTFYGWNTDKSLWTYLRDFLHAYTPDVVHFQHTLFFGYDMIREVRNALPNATILYTLHDFIPICNQHGQMVRTINDDQLCTHSSTRRCHECFPNHSPQAFFMRKRYIQAMFELVDLFIAPSEFLRQRYIEWGIAPERIRLEENGCAHDVPRASALDGNDQRLRNRLGYFGQLNRFKGIHILLDAMRLLQKEGVDAHLWIHGANLDLQTIDFQKQVADLVTGSSDNVTLVGRYEQDALPRLMAGVDWVIVPSIWWENSPLVIQEAFLHGRPVICSDIGGMAEKVTDGVNGLHFHARDAVSLARTLRRAATTPDLWHSLQKGIPTVHRMEDHVATLSQLYLDLIALKRHSADAAVVRL
jgi:glycosyltransferase involved in cell wall biosynthesis